MILTLFLAVNTSAQLDCFHGLRLYVRDASGAEIGNVRTGITFPPAPHWVPEYEYNEGHHDWIESEDYEMTGTDHEIKSVLREREGY